MIRYPGSKAKIVAALMARFPSEIVMPLFQGERLEYREPFVGAGAVGFELLPRLPSRCRVWLNDKDYAIAALWKTVLEAPNDLVDQVQRFEPSVDAFYRFKEEDGALDMDPTRAAFQKLALHQLSFSGNGAMAGGPIGGRKQRSEFNVDCRWNADRICLQIRKRSRLLRKFVSVKISSGDFEPLIVDAPACAFIYADPPYCKAGPQLYKHAMSDDDHARLSRALRACKAQWVLSYDDHELVRQLYDWAEIRSIAITYTTGVAHERRRKNSELVIRPRISTINTSSEASHA